jgi:hypothetical protein
VIKRIVALLVGGFVSISIAVAFIPSVTGIVTSGTSGATKAVLDIALWLIPLGVGFLIVMMGLRSLGGKKRRARSSLARKEAKWADYAMYSHRIQSQQGRGRTRVPGEARWWRRVGGYAGRNTLGNPH